MRFKTELKNIRTFSKMVAALNSLEKIAWVRLQDDTVRFTVIPDTGSQVWASLSMDFLFENYHIQSAEEHNTINLELPLVPLQRALRSAVSSTACSMRLTKRNGLPVLSLTIHTTTKDHPPPGGFGGGGHSNYGPRNDNNYNPYEPSRDDDSVFNPEPLEMTLKSRGEREKVITHDIPVRVLHPDTVETIMQPTARESEVHIRLPPLLQLKAISDRFTRLAATSSSSGRSGGNAANPKLELSANMHGSLRLRIKTDSLEIASTWDNLENPELDPGQIVDKDLREHPSTKFREEGPDKWATVRLDGKDWSRVLSVGRLEGNVIACFSDEHALLLYVYLPQYDDASADESVMTYYISSFSA